MRWRTEKMCDNCPFARSGPGRFLRRTLGLARWRSILKDLRAGRHFHCHKTAFKARRAKRLLCAGSLDWQMKNIGQHADLGQIMERLDAWTS